MSLIFKNIFTIFEIENTKDKLQHSRIDKRMICYYKKKSNLFVFKRNKEVSTVYVITKIAINKGPRALTVTWLSDSTLIFCQKGSHLQILYKDF